MNIWDRYPEDYRSLEVGLIQTAVRSGGCAAVIGLSGAGKSNLLGFLAQRSSGPDLPGFALVDCNRLASPTVDGFFNLVSGVMEGASNPSSLEAMIAARLESSPNGLCLLVDRFDALAEVGLSSISSQLRALRDAFKYSLTYVIAARRPLDPASELAELFFAHTIWLGPLAESDARWSAADFARRRGLDWPEDSLNGLVEISGGYPGLLRACCEAYAAGASLELPALKASPSVRRRVDEFWRDEPSDEMLTNSGLSENPLLSAARPSSGIPSGAEFDSSGLTAAEYRLWSHLQAHTGEVCNKDDLIQAVWPEEVHAEGLRDDSLAQLVRRLRRKIEPNPGQPARILTVPGRGYRFVG